MANNEQTEPGQSDASMPIFIVGMNGSGTTMLVDSLGRHSKLYGINRETRMMPYVIQSIAKLGDLGDDDVLRKAWDLARNIPAIKFVNGGEAPALPDNWKALPRTVDAIFDGVYRQLAEKEGKRLWCEKTPQHVQHLKLLAEVFPTAKFVHIIRDGRACAASFHRRWKRSPELTVFRWKNVVRMGREDGRDLGDRYFEVHYEALTRDPETWMRRICEFLGLEFEPVVLESSDHQSSDKDADGRIKARTDAWRRHISKRRGKRLESIAGAYLQELGYTLAYLDQGGSEDLSDWEKKYLRAKDSAWLFMLSVTRKFGGSKKPWSRILTQPLESIRQAKINDY